ncbi:hypothetical protein Glove_493g13 [Diversispora epigaea]|uniref:Tc1-like transposase DDE domain-containing protein n=1 Tax=Diversispora epigaea TaxID=1348612 RepID=A0A397GMH4_9GLOM|nr:hypothetical protein Glove_493g13 [Diversispora epigaea]
MNILKSLIQNKVDWYLDELVFKMKNYTSKKVSVSTLWRTLKYIEITYKKLQVMNPYPGKHSVIIMNNACIHHNAELIETIEALGCRLQVMNPYPGKHSVIIMNNACIHHNAELIETIEALGCRVIFLLHYSPDYNPIETTFFTIKLWIKYNQIFMKSYNDPIYALHIACVQITTKMTKLFYTSLIYCNM